MLLLLLLLRCIAFHSYQIRRWLAALVKILRYRFPIVWPMDNEAH
jgi:hypothetical protein